MNAKLLIKTWIGKSLITFCNCVRPSRSFLKPWGLRTSKEWFGDRLVRVCGREGSSFKLSHVSQNYLSFELFWRGLEYYEPISIRLVQELVQPGQVFLDVGANIGFFTLALTAVHSALRVVAFEPNPKNFGILRRNIEINHLKEVTCERYALSDFNGKAMLYLSPSDMSASLEADFQEEHAGGMEVSVMTLDDYLASRGLDGKLLIKVDVEGHEEAFFRGAERTLTLRGPDVITEVTTPFAESTLSLLRRAGYAFYSITDEGLTPAADVRTVIRGRYVFLNFLLSVRPWKELTVVSKRLKAAANGLDLAQTSKLMHPALVKKLADRTVGHCASIMS